MNPSTSRYSSDGGDASKFSFLGEQLTTYSSFQHNQQPSDSTGLSFSGASLSHSHAQAAGQNLIPQSRQQPQGLVGSNAASKPISLHQLVDFGMGSSGPILSAQLVHGLQESARAPSPVADASSQALMTTLLLLQQKIGHLQTLVQLIAQGDMSNASATQQQMTTAAGIATVISQLVTAAAGWLPQVHQQFQHPLSDQRSHFGSTSSPDMAFFQYNGPPSSLGTAFGISAGNGRFNSSVDRGRENNSGVESVVVKTRLDGSPEIGRQLFEAHGGHASSCTIRSSLETTAGNSLVGSFAVSLGTSGDGTINLEEENIALCVGNPFVSSISMEINSSSKDQDSGGVYKEDEDDGEAENLPPGSYELIELEAIEILAEHTHFCEICGKGFKRDANLRMHMRGHGDEYKTVAALTKPDKSSQDPSLRKPRRYSCPYLGCKRNKNHRKFLPLKTMLCVKNHYRRSHCPKMLTCTKCRTKKFSVAADLKTHEKHCGRDKWQCSCGTTFSRKDKLLGHVGLFVGHAPATPLHEIDMGGSGMERTETQSASGNGTTNICSQGFTK